MGQANQNVPFNDPIIPSINQSALYLRLDHASDASRPGVCFDAIATHILLATIIGH